ncbi:MAG TPA: cytochrome c-type biogenesis protein [Gemmatimonadaceae bacterium]
MTVGGVLMTAVLVAFVGVPRPGAPAPVTDGAAPPLYTAQTGTQPGAPVGIPGARDSALEATTTLLASELRCPVCQGNSIQDSPSELAQEMRNLIRDQLRAGKSPDDVRAYFVDKYGEWILLAPKPEGLNLVVYLVPFLAILVGGAVVWRTVRKWTAHNPVPPT